MPPQPDASVLPYKTFTTGDGEDESINTHTFSVADYVIIHQCDPPCVDCEFIKISDKQALQLSLKEEKLQNEKYREKLNDIVKKYGKSLRQVDYLKKKIDTLTRQLMDERRGKENIKTDYDVIDNDIQSDDDIVEFPKRPKLEIIME